MLVRILSGAAGLVLFFIVMFSPANIILTALALLSVLALFEVFKAYGYKNKLFFLLGILLSLAFAYGEYIGATYIYAVIFIMFLMCVITMLKNHEKVLSKDVFTVIFLNILIPLVFSLVGYLKKGENGNIYIWLPFLAAWVTDTFAYFSGRFFGKHKLCEKISPKKTIEGAIGGTLGAIIGFLVYTWAMGTYHGLSFNYINVVVLAASSSILSQLGDLFASTIKRENNIKLTFCP